MENGTKEGYKRYKKGPVGTTGSSGEGVGGGWGPHPSLPLIYKLYKFCCTFHKLDSLPFQDDCYSPHTLFISSRSSRLDYDFTCSLLPPRHFPQSWPPERKVNKFKRPTENRKAKRK